MAQAQTPFTVSERAAKRVAELIAREGDAALKLRIAVNGGGCSGFQYDFRLDRKVEAGDVTVERDGVTVVIDEASLLYMMGAEVDFTEELVGSYFKVSNPNAQSSCGCGTSFSV